MASNMDAEGNRSSLDVESNKRGNVRGQMLVCFIANLLSLMQGCVIIMSSIILPQIQEKHNNNTTATIESLSITSEQGSWFASLYCGGYILGALLGGVQSDFFGRRKSLMIDCLVAFVGTAMIAIANSFYILLIGRYLGGHACGSGLVSLPAYNSEISHSSLRGTLSGMLVLLYYAGTCCMATLGAIFPWRYAVGLCCIIPVLNATGLYFSPESPTWLFRFGYKEEAKKSLMFFRGSESEVNKELYILERSLQNEKNSEKTSSYAKKLKEVVTSFWEPSFRRPMMFLMYLIIVVCPWSGLGFITFYLVTFLQKINVPVDPYVAAAFISFYRFVVGLVSLFGMFKIRRRVMAITCLSFMTLGNSLTSIHQYLLYMKFWVKWGMENHVLLHWLPIASILILYGAMAFGFGPTVKALQGELLPSKKRSLGGSILGISDGISMFVVTKVAPTLLTKLQPHGCFALFSLSLISGIVACYFFMPETQGRHLSEIEKYYETSKEETNT